MARKIVLYSPSDLRPHALNKELYGPPTANEAYENVRFSMQRGGFDERHPLLVTREGRIISGVTRWFAAKSLKLESVPCEVFAPLGEETAELEIEAKLILENGYRAKTRLVVAREQQKLVELEKVLARKRMSQGRGDDDDGPSKSTERAAIAFKTSGQTVLRNLRVLAGIDAARERGDERTAKSLIDLLERGKPGKALELIAKDNGESKKKTPAKVDVPRTIHDHATAAHSEFYEACCKAEIEEELRVLEQYLVNMTKALETARERLTQKAAQPATARNVGSKT
jgi:ParB-like chromosome segregation protein Spo0J